MHLYLAFMEVKPLWGQMEYSVLFFWLRPSALMACRRHATLHTHAAQRCVAGFLPVVWKNKQYTFGKIGKTLRLVDSSSKELFQGHKSYPVAVAANVSKIFVFSVKKKTSRVHETEFLRGREVLWSQFPHIYCQHKYGTPPWDAPQRVVMTMELAATGSDAQAGEFLPSLPLWQVCLFTKEAKRKLQKLTEGTKFWTDSHKKCLFPKRTNARNK